MSTTGRAAAHHITLTTPIQREDIEDIRVGDVVFLSEPGPGPCPVSPLASCQGAPAGGAAHSFYKPRS